MNLFIAFMLGYLFDLICDLMVEPIRKHWRKECNYDCSTCRVWDCVKHSCDRKRNRDMKGRKEID